MSKQKRGRPDVFAKHSVGAGLKAMCSPDCNTYKTMRTAADSLYAAKGQAIISEAASEIPYSELFVNDVAREVHCKGALAQLGRMQLQDDYIDSYIIAVAKAAAKARHDGYTAKEIERYIARCRKD